MILIFSLQWQISILLHWTSTSRLELWARTSSPKLCLLTSTATRWVAEAAAVVWLWWNIFHQLPEGFSSCSPVCVVFLTTNRTCVLGITSGRPTAVQDQPSIWPLNADSLEDDKIKLLLPKIIFNNVEQGPRLLDCDHRWSFVTSATLQMVAVGGSRIKYLTVTWCHLIALERKLIQSLWIVLRWTH